MPSLTAELPTLKSDYLQLVEEKLRRLPLGTQLDLCRAEFAYFCNHFCYVLSGAADADWVAFQLWPSQVEVAVTFQNNRMVVVLKARQLGMTWLAVAFALWLMLFFPIQTVLLFSLRDDEAVEIKERLKGMYDHLPDWLRERFPIAKDNDHEFALANGSRALAFSTSSGDSYTGTLAIVDEADLIPDLARLMRSVKPTIDGGGRMIMLSRVDKFREEAKSPFKMIYRGAKEGKTKWKAVFLPWHARPGRDAKWYAETKAEAVHRTHNDDEMAEQYPATDEEALAPPNYGGRFKADWFRYYRRADAAGNYWLFGEKKYHKDTLGGRFVTVDPATSVKETAKDDPDWTVIAAWAKTTCGLLVSLACVRLRVESPDIYPALAIVYSRFKCGKAIIEGGGIQKGVPQTAKRERLPTAGEMANALPWLQAKIAGGACAPLAPFTGQFMNIVPFAPGGQDKLDRAQDMLNMAEAGRIWIPMDDPEYPLADVKSELQRFTGDPKRQIHDDIWDNFSMAGKEVTSGSGVTHDFTGQGKFGSVRTGISFTGFER